MPNPPDWAEDHYAGWTDTHLVRQVTSHAGPAGAGAHAELSRRHAAAMRKSNRTITKLTRRVLWLTVLLVVLTTALLALTVALLTDSLESGKEHDTRSSVA